MPAAASMTILAAAALAGAFAATTTARANDDRGWWVVVGAVSATQNRVSPGARAEARRIEAAARRCGITTISEFSDRFSLFDRDQLVVVAGPYPSRTAADAVAARTVPCIEGAYVRNSIYKGE